MKISRASRMYFANEGMSRNYVVRRVDHVFSPFGSYLGIMAIARGACDKARGVEPRDQLRRFDVARGAGDSANALLSKTRLRHHELRVPCRKRLSPTAAGRNNSDHAPRGLRPGLFAVARSARCPRLISRTGRPGHVRIALRR